MSNRQRDASMERLLREAMAGDHRPASECLDPETLAAWMDGTLVSSERSFAEAHAARCARCQAILATMARTAPAPAEATPSRVRRWLMIAGPALAAAAAVTLWFAVGPREGQQVGIQEEQSARGNAAPPAPSAPAPVTAPASPPSADRPFARADKAPDGERQRIDARTGAEQRREAAAKLVDARAGAEKDTAGAVAKTEPAEISEAARQRFQSGVPMPAPPPPAAAAPRMPGQQQTAQGQQVPQAAGRSQADQRQQIDQTVAANRTAALAGGSAGGTRADEGRGAPGVVSESVAVRMAPGNVDVTVPSSNVRWRVLGGRTVQRSIDNGATWATQYNGDEHMMLLAGIAPTPTTAWLVGRAGVLLITADGYTWRRVSFPEAVDITSVTALDARVAAVTTADKRTFTTADGGTTWKRQ